MWMSLKWIRNKRRASDPIWSLKVCDIERSIVNKNEPVLSEGWTKVWFRWRRASDCSFGTEFSSEGIRGSNSSLFSFSSPVFIHSNLSVINVSRSWRTGYNTVHSNANDSLYESVVPLEKSFRVSDCSFGTECSSEGIRWFEKNY